MKTFTRRGAAREINVTSNHLLYWEEQGELKPKKVRAGDNILVIYTPELIEKARKIFSRRKKGKK